ncbi:MAG: SIMPL domain-containing protein [Anaerolineales bacterium]|nr:SIMPL domain-containing protein [Anaerolineales bacterium]
MRSKLILLVLVLALALSACSGSVATTPPNHNISVTGNGIVYLTPDIAYIYVGVHTEDPDIAQAVERNNTQAQAVVDALKNMGVAAVDIQTSSFSVYSSQQYDPMTNQPSGYSYMVDNTVYITVRDLTTLGRLLNTVVSAGANNINSIQFDVADKTAAQAEARQKAMDAAASLAQELAGIAGVQLAEVQNISYSDYSPSYYYGVGGGGGGKAPNATVPIQPGQIQISVSVSVTYGIK